MPKAMPRRPRQSATFADVVAGWRPELLRQAESEDDEDLDAVAAMEELTPVEHLTLRLRYLKERRLAAQRVGPIGREDFLRLDAEISAIAAETREARPWPVRVQAAADAYQSTTQRVDGIRADLEVARTAVARFEAELATAEKEQAAARTALDRVQAEAAGVPAGMPAFTSQDIEVIAVLRELVTQAGMPVQDLLRQVAEAVAYGRIEAAKEAAREAGRQHAARAAQPGGLVEGQAPGGGSGGLGTAAHAAPPLATARREVQQGPTTTSSPTSDAPVAASPTLSEIMARGLQGAASPVAEVAEARGSGSPMLAQPATEDGGPEAMAPTQAFLPGAAAALANALTVPAGASQETLEETQPVGRRRPRSPRPCL